MYFSVLTAGIFIIFILAGLRSGRNIDREGWLFAGKGVPLTLSLFSLIATTIGGSATIVTAYMVFRHGWSGLAADLPVGLGMLLLGIFFAGRIRKSGAATVPEYIGGRYGRTMRKITAGAIVVTELGWFGLLIKAFGVFLPAETALSPEVGTAVVGILFLTYIYFGGQRGVYLTDFFQSLIIIAGFIFLLVTVSGFSRDAVTRTHHFVPLGTADYLTYFFIMLMAGLSGPDVMSRLFFSKDRATASLALTAGGIIKIVTSLTVGFIAVRAAVSVPEITNGYELFPSLFRFSLESFPASVMITVFLIIMVSSADTVLMTAIATLNNDILERPLPLRKIKYQVWFLGLAGILLALYFSTVLDIMKFAYTFYAAGPALFIIYGAFNIRLSPRPALLIFILSGGTALLASLFTGDNLHYVLYALILNIVMTVIFSRVQIWKN
jgi:SSS family solute:Na+ symporter